MELFGENKIRGGVLSQEINPSQWLLQMQLRAERKENGEMD